MEVSLDHVRPGVIAQVVLVRARGVLAGRLRDLGITPGACVRCSEKSANGQVTALELNGVTLLFSTRDLETVRVAIRQS